MERKQRKASNHKSETEDKNRQEKQVRQMHSPISGS